MLAGPSNGQVPMNSASWIGHDWVTNDPTDCIKGEGTIGFSA